MRAELEVIERVRETNNHLWMGIVDIALRFAPEETKELLSLIRANDLKVSAKMGQIVDDHSR